MFSSSQLKPAQKEKIAKFAQVTGARCVRCTGSPTLEFPAEPPTPRSDKTAKTYLTAASWNLELAVDSFFLSGGDANAGSARPSSTVNAAELTNLFNKYKGAKL